MMAIAHFTVGYIHTYTYNITHRYVIYADVWGVLVSGVVFYTVGCSQTQHVAENSPELPALLCLLRAGSLVKHHHTACIPASKTEDDADRPVGS